MTNALDQNAPEGGQALLDKIAKMEQLIQNQQAMLTSPEFLQARAPAPAPVAEPKQEEITTPQQLIDYMMTQMDNKIQSNNDSFAREIVPLVKRATPESEIWAKTEEANKIVRDNPGMTMDVALELAESRMAKQATHDAQLKEEADKLEADRQRREASLGYRNNSTTPDPQRQTHSLEEAAEANWQKFGMDGAIADRDAGQGIDDPWAGDNKTIKIQDL